MPTADVAASVLIIEELTGDQRTVQLQGRALPYRPFIVSTGQRVEVTWLPGVAEGTGTVLGPEDFPTSMNGFWKDKFIQQLQGDGPLQLNGQTVQTVVKAVSTFESIANSGQLLQLTWFTTKRQGYLKKFTQKWHNSHDVEWEMDFEWISKGEPMGPPVFASTAQAGDTSSIFNQSLDNLLNIQLALPMNLDVFAPIRELTTAIDSAVTNIENIVIQLTDAVISPMNATKGLVATCTGIVDECNILSEYVASTLTRSFIAGSPDLVTPNQLLTVEAFKAALREILRELRSDALERRDAFANQIQGDLAGTYLARYGDDLRDVSRLFYDTPFEWQRIMLFNGLTSSELTPGQFILVPKINTLDP